MCLIQDPCYWSNAYVDLFGWPHDANLVLNVLISVLSKREVLPDVLYLQNDNTARENKNQYVLGFLALLVEVAVFKEVRMFVYCVYCRLDCLWHQLATCLSMNVDSSELFDGRTYSRGHRPGVQLLFLVSQTELGV